jgi:hypothetical protein
LVWSVWFLWFVSFIWFSGFFGFPISQPDERDKPNKLDKPVLGPANKIDQID